jgi:hypothetical protein
MLTDTKTLCRNWLVRQVAARALAPLVSTQRLDELLAMLSELLPADADAPGRSNAVHGLLVQTRTVLDSHVHALLATDFDARRAVATSDDADAAQLLSSGEDLHDNALQLRFGQLPPALAARLLDVSVPTLLSRVAWLATPPSSTTTTTTRFCAAIAAELFKLAHRFLQRTLRRTQQTSQLLCTFITQAGEAFCFFESFDN